jgi:hypothetical protein
MASADYHSGIPVLPATHPQTETSTDGLGGCCMLGAGWVAPRWPWDNGGRHGREARSASGAHFVSVLCVVLRGRHRCRDKK